MKKMKRLLSITLAALMMVGASSLSAFAAETEEAVDENAAIVEETVSGDLGPATAVGEAEERISESGETYYLVHEGNPMSRAAGDYCSGSGYSTWHDNASGRVYARGYTNVKNSKDKEIYHYTTVTWEDSSVRASAKAWGTGDVYAQTYISQSLWNSSWSIHPVVYWGT